MKHIVKTFIISLILSSCDSEIKEGLNTTTIKNTTNINAFTNQYNQLNLENKVELPILQQQTVNQIINIIEILKNFNTQKINQFIKQNQLNFNIVQTKPFESKTNFTDGSNIEIHTISFADNNILQQHQISNLNIEQCKFINNYYQGQLNYNIRFENIEKNIGSTKITQLKDCNDFDNKEIKNATLTLNLNKDIKSKKYNKDSIGIIKSLLNKEFEETINEQRINLYFSEINNYEPKYKDFILGIDYVIDKTNGDVILDAVNYADCKELIYNLPSVLKTNIQNNKNSCEKINRMVFNFKKTNSEE